MILSIIKFVHVLAVILYMGTLIGGMLWFHYAVKSGSNAILGHTTKIIMKVDRMITIPAVIVLFLAGVFASMAGHFSIHRTGWIIWSFVMLVVAGFAFSAKLAPLHRKILLETEKQEAKPGFTPELLSLIKSRKTWIIAANLTTWLAFVMMMFRFPG